MGTADRETIAESMSPHRNKDTNISQFFNLENSGKFRQ